MLSINGGEKLKHVTVTSKPDSVEDNSAHTNPNVTFHYRIKGNKGHVLQKQISVFIILLWLRCKNIYGRVLTAWKCHKMRKLAFCLVHWVFICMSIELSILEAKLFKNKTKYLIGSDWMTLFLTLWFLYYLVLSDYSHSALWVLEYSVCPGQTDSRTLELFL